MTCETEKGLDVVAIVDDDTSVRRALSRLMRACGLSVATYESAEQFLEKSTSERIACLLLDLQMSGMSGIELLDHLQATGNPPPTIIITAHAGDAAFAQVKQSGITVLHKPIESATLVAAVGAAIGRHLPWDD